MAHGTWHSIVSVPENGVTWHYYTHPPSPPNPTRSKSRKGSENRELTKTSFQTVQADHESDVCDDPTCKKYFNYFVRRHHCRRCGNIFCDSHSSHEVPLDESANYNPRGQLSRCCAHCYGDFKLWRGRTGSQGSGSSSSMMGGAGQRTPQQGSRTVPASPISASPMPGASPTTPGKSQPEVALSVPSDWNWSTF